MKLNPADRVFVSSPFGDIHPYREQASLSLQSLGLHPILLEKKWGPLQRDSIDEKVARKVRDEVSKCSAVIVILGERQNRRVPGTEFTMVEHEIRAAQESNISVFTYVTPYSRFFDFLNKRYLTADTSQIKLLAQSDEVVKTNDPSHFASIIERHMKLRLIKDVSSRQVFNISPIQRHFWTSLYSNSEQLDRCPARYFEEIVSELLRADGWDDVQIVADSSMPGPDIIACSFQTIDSEAKILVVECKRWRKDIPVRVREVEKLIHWLDKYYKTTLGMIVTTSFFDEKAQSLADQEVNRLTIDLVNQENLIGWLRQHTLLKGR